jgi:hypothetical protein
MTSEPPTSIARRSDLSPGRRWLIDLCRNLHFGRLERLTVAGGEPQSDPAPRRFRELKFAAGDIPRPEPVRDHYLKPQVIELLQALDDLGDGVIDVLEIKHGLPFRLIVADPA